MWWRTISRGISAGRLRKEGFLDADILAEGVSRTSEMESLRRPGVRILEWKEIGAGLHDIRRLSMRVCLTMWLCGESDLITSSAYTRDEPRKGGFLACASAGWEATVWKELIKSQRKTLRDTLSVPGNSLLQLSRLRISRVTSGELCERRFLERGVLRADGEPGRLTKGASKSSLLNICWFQAFGDTLDYTSNNCNEVWTLVIFTDFKKQVSIRLAISRFASLSNPFSRSFEDPRLVYALGIILSKMAYSLIFPFAIVCRFKMSPCLYIHSGFFWGSSKTGRRQKEVVLVIVSNRSIDK